MQRVCCEQHVKVGGETVEQFQMKEKKIEMLVFLRCTDVFDDVIEDVLAIGVIG